MAIKFGSQTGRRERVDYRIDDAELECGLEIYTYNRQIEKNLTYEDEFFTCSIGVIADITGTFPDTTLSGVCLEQVEVRLRENVRPKYKPPRVYTLDEVVQLSADGSAVNVLACDIYVRYVDIEINARYKSDGNYLISIDELMTTRTADSATTLIGVLGFDPRTLVSNWTVISKTLDKPIDDFWTQEITYRGRIAYPTDAQRDLYINPVATALGITIDKNTSSVDITTTFRTGDTPRRRVSITVYGVPDVNS